MVDEIALNDQKVRISIILEERFINANKRPIRKQGSSFITIWDIPKQIAPAETELDR